MCPCKKCAKFCADLDEMTGFVPWMKEDVGKSLSVVSTDVRKTSDDIVDAATMRNSEEGCRGLEENGNSFPGWISSFGGKCKRRVATSFFCCPEYTRKKLCFFQKSCY